MGSSEWKWCGRATPVQTDPKTAAHRRPGREREPDFMISGSSMATGLRIYSLVARDAGSTSEPLAGARIAELGFDTVHVEEADSPWSGRARRAGLRIMTDIAPGHAPWPQIDDALNRGSRAFRCLAAPRVPAEAWRRLIAAARRKAPDCLFCAEALGRPQQELWALEGAGFDYLFSSVGWWNGRDTWFQEQAPLFERVAPALGFPVAAPDAGGAERRRRYLLAAFPSRRCPASRGLRARRRGGGGPLRLHRRDQSPEGGPARALGRRSAAAGRLRRPGHRPLGAPGSAGRGERHHRAQHRALRTRGQRRPGAGAQPGPGLRPRRM